MPHSASARPPRLVLRFALFAGVAVAVTFVLALFVVRANAAADAEHDVWDDAQYVADELGRDDLAGAAFVRPVDADLEAQLDEVVGVIASARGLTRVALVAPDGRITYATDHARIGSRLNGETLERSQKALAGRDWFGIVSGGGPKMIESVVPVQWLLGGREHTAGVLVADRRYSAVADAIRQDLRFQAGAVLLALLVLYLALLPILRRVTSTLELQNRELGESEARYRALTEQASDGIVVCDEDGGILEANASLATLTGHSRSELERLNIRELIDPEDLARLPLRFPELLAGKTVLQERRIVRKNGSSFQGEFHGTLLEDGRVYASLRDVTERRRLEDELRRAHRSEEQAGALGAAATEFVSLLGTIDAQGRRVLRELSAEHPAHAAALELRDATTWATSLVRRLEERNDGHEAKLETVDPGELVERMRETLRLLLGKRGELVLELESTEHVEVDPYHLEKVLLDLVLHARDSMPHGGTVTVRLSNVEFERRVGEGRRLGEGCFVMLAVSDTGRIGPGRGAMPFEPAPRDDLLGPGLAAVYAIVQRTGGSVGIESEPDLGTTVRVYLPSVDEDARAEPELRAV